MVKQPANICPDGSVCVMGLGYVGLTLAVALADVGFDVLGVEIRKTVLDLLAEGKAHFYEPGLEQKLQKVLRSGNLKLSDDISENWEGSVFIITVGTPLDAEGRSRVDMIENVSSQVAKKLKNNDLVIMRSTVKLGATRKIVMPILEGVGCNYDLAFCPERTLEGNALVELRSLPQIVGGASYNAGVRASQLFQFLTPTVIRVSDVETAEMIKLIDNAQRDVAFAYANEVARACDAIGVSAIEVIKAGKLGYPRTNLPMPGPVGGPCLEKDPHILAEGLFELGVEPAITMSARKVNENQPTEIANYLSSMTTVLDGFDGEPVITLMGIAFKGRPATDDLRGTMAKPLLVALRKAFPKAKFHGYDPVVKRSDIVDFGLEPQNELEGAFEGASLVVIMNNHEVFGNMPIEDLAKLMKNPAIIYDFWNFFKTNNLNLPSGVIYSALGSHGLANLPHAEL